VQDFENDLFFLAEYLVKKINAASALLLVCKGCSHFAMWYWQDSIQQFDYSVPWKEKKKRLQRYTAPMPCIIWKSLCTLIASLVQLLQIKAQLAKLFASFEEPSLSMHACC
jgi:hypothetical protein